MKRRQFILSILGGFIGVLELGGPRLGRAAPPLDSPLLKPIEAEIEGLFSDLEGARAVGRRYLERFPEQANRTLLLEKSGLAIFQKGHPPGGRALLKAALDQRRREDFLAGNTVILDGWIVAQSEASLCALLALSH